MQTFIKLTMIYPTTFLAKISIAIIVTRHETRTDAVYLQSIRNDSKIRSCIPAPDQQQLHKRFSGIHRLKT